MGGRAAAPLPASDVAPAAHRGLGALPRSTPALAAFQDNTCEDWSGVSQPGEDLQSAILDNADLSAGNLAGAILVNASLVNADLSGTSLANTNLAGADLSAANLTDADLAFANLNGTLFDESTVFPSGLDFDSGDWGLPGDATPWDLGMIPAPEPAIGLMLAVGGVALAAVGRPRR